MAQFFNVPSRVLTTAGRVAPGAKVYFYETGTTTPVTVYSDAAMLTPHATPVVADAYGAVPDIYFNPDSEIRVRVLTSANVEIFDIDPFNPDPYSQSDGALRLGFIQAGTGAVAETVQAALRREVWADSYKSPSDTDDTSCITKAVNALATVGGGGVVRLSRRTYTLNTNLTFTAKNNVEIAGAGCFDSGTIINATSTTGDTITFSNCQHSGISGVYFRPTIRKTGGYSIVFTDNSYRCFVKDCRGDYIFNGVNVISATECRIDGWDTNYILGAINVNFQGTLAAPSYRLIVKDQLHNNAYSVATSGVITWAPVTAMALGRVFVANNAIYQVTTAGTSGASAPNGQPSGTTPQSVFTGTITDGTAQVKWVCHAALTHQVMNSYAYSLVSMNCGLIDGARGQYMVDDSATGTSFPRWWFNFDVEVDHAFNTGIDLQGGEGWYDCGGAWVSSTMNGNGYVLGASFRGDFAQSDEQRCYGNGGYGLLRYAGPTDIVLRGEFSDNSQLTANTYDGIFIEAGSVDTRIYGARSGDGIGVAGNAQRYGVNVGNNADKLVIKDCYLRGNTTGAINLGTGLTNSRIIDNEGYNPVGPSAITVGASPYTYTAGPTPEDVYIRGGTVSDVKIGGTTVWAATNCMVHLEPGQSAVVTYAVLPTMVKNIA